MTEHLARKHRILIIEDDADASNLIFHTIQDEGYQASQAFDGKRGLEMIQECHPDLVLLDIMLPNLDGIELLRAIRTDPATVSLPVLLLTAKDEFGDKLKGFKAGADDYITKPFMIGELLARIRAHLRIQELKHDLKISEARYRSLIEHSPDGILLITPGHELLFHNNRFIEIMEGHLQFPIIGKPLAELIPQSDLFGEFRVLVQQVQEKKGLVTREIRISRSNHQTIFLEVLVMPIASEGNEVEMYQLITRNVTQRRKMEEALLQAEKIHSLGILTAGIAHEVNNPLTGISNAIQIIKKSELAPDRRGDLCDLILTHINRIAKIIKELHIFSKPHGQPPEIFPVAEAITETINLARYQSRKGKVDFIWAPPSPSIYLFGDRNQFQQVMINLLVNAIQACDSGGQISVTLERSSDRVVINVSDTGCGIPPDQLGRIFDPFFTTKRDWKGTGLGLAVSYRIIQLFKGTLNVQSTVGKGTRFTISIPVFQHPREASGKPVQGGNPGA